MNKPAFSGPLKRAGDLQEESMPGPTLRLDRETKRKITPYLLIAPVIIYYIIFWLFPVINAIGGSFLSTTLDKGGIFTLANYKAVFKDPIFWQRKYFICLRTVIFQLVWAKKEEIKCRKNLVQI